MLDKILDKSAEFIMRAVMIIFIIILLVNGIHFVENAYESTIENPKTEGYAIIHHCDGDEYVDFYSYTTYNGLITVHTNDDRYIVSNNITLIIEEKA